MKHFVLDTNVLLHDHNALYSFGDNAVVIPIFVIEELDTFKKDLSELGRNARTVSRYLDKHRQQGSLIKGVPLPNGGLLRVGFSERRLPKSIAENRTMDNAILSVALDVKETAAEGDAVIFVTKDTNLRIRADAVGVHAEDYDTDNIDIEELYRGWFEQPAPDELIDQLYENGSIDLDLLTVENNDTEGLPLHENEYVLLRGIERPSHTALCRCEVGKNQLTHLSRLRDGVWGIRARNKEQHFGLDALLNDDIKLVTLVGKAGTGKTLLAIAAGLSRVTDAGTYHKLLVSRPIFPLGRDIGYLPGSVEEKLNPWMQPIYDNVELLLNLSKTDRKEGRGHHELVDQGFIEIEPLTYIRGRSIPNQYLIVDEAQNLTPHEVKTIITRAGDGTKVILTGDPYQIDNPYVDSVNNGLTYTVSRFMNEPIAAHITLTRGERSELAELAANLL